MCLSDVMFGLFRMKVILKFDEDFKFAALFMMEDTFKFHFCFLKDGKIEMASMHRAEKAFIKCSVPETSILEYTNTENRVRIVESELILWKNTKNKYQ